MGVGSGGGSGIVIVTVCLWAFGPTSELVSKQDPGAMKTGYCSLTPRWRGYIRFLWKAQGGVTCHLHLFMYLFCWYQATGEMQL